MKSTGRSSLDKSTNEIKALKKLGKRIGELISQRDISAEKLAYEGGISKGYMYDLIKGNSNPSMVILLRLSKALGVNLKDLFL